MPPLTRGLSAKPGPLALVVLARTSLSQTVVAKLTPVGCVRGAA
ncbi:hypothetical protein ABIB14_002272 [Arthrobacter sp. UYEF3]